MKGKNNSDDNKNINDSCYDDTITIAIAIIIIIIIIIIEFMIFKIVII